MWCHFQANSREGTKFSVFGFDLIVHCFNKVYCILLLAFVPRKIIIKIESNIWKYDYVICFASHWPSIVIETGKYYIKMGIYWFSIKISSRSNIILFSNYAAAAPLLFRLFRFVRREGSKYISNKDRIPFFPFLFIHGVHSCLISSWCCIKTMLLTLSCRYLK